MKPVQWWVMSGATLALAGCVPPGRAPTAPGYGFATVLVSGPNVTVNRVPAANGTRIGSRDVIETGPASSAVLQFDAGGSVQLDEKTDPETLDNTDAGFWQYLPHSVRCSILVLFGSGQIYADAESDICVKNGADNILPNSRFNLRGDAARSDLTVIEGHVNVAGAATTQVTTGQQVGLQNGVVLQRRGLGAAELAGVISWRQRYRFFPRTVYVRPPPPVVPPIVVPGAGPPPFGWGKPPQCPPGAVFADGQCRMRRPAQCAPGLRAMQESCVPEPPHPH